MHVLLQVHAKLTSELISVVLTVPVPVHKAQVAFAHDTVPPSSRSVGNTMRKMFEKTINVVKP